MAEIASEFLPAGVLNVVTGKGSVIGEALLNHPDVDKVSFTGSTDVGRHVAEVGGKRLAHVSLELGGKSPNIVFPDAASPDNINATADGVLTAMRFTRQGQSCTAGSRLFVHAEVYDEFLSVLVDKVSKLKVGDPLDESSDMGSIINAKQFESIMGYIEDGKSQAGISVPLDGSSLVPEGLNGFYTGPTIFSGVDNNWRIAQEEIFGPVLVAIPWRDRDEVIDMANNSHFGLGAYIWSNNLTDALDTAHRVESGWVQVNQGGGQVIGQSYGGYKTSGIGREFSIEGAMDAFTQIKQINVKLK
jgi:aldehyde dehydrogenase (NAD+)